MPVHVRHGRSARDDRRKGKPESARLSRRADRGQGRDGAAMAGAHGSPDRRSHGGEDEGRLPARPGSAAAGDHRRISPRRTSCANTSWRWRSIARPRRSSSTGATGATRKTPTSGTRLWSSDGRRAVYRSSNRNGAAWSGRVRTTARGRTGTESARVMRKRWIIIDRISIVSDMAICAPTQTRGPAPKGR